jgi:hypothetical protein
VFEVLVSVEIKFPTTFVVNLNKSKYKLKKLAGFVNAKSFIAVNGYADDLLHVVSAGA